MSTDNYNKLGNRIREPGEAISSGLTAAAAAELGLIPGIKVATSMIDAHAGALALFGCNAQNVNPNLISKMGRFSLHFRAAKTFRLFEQLQLWFVAPLLATWVWHRSLSGRTEFGDLMLVQFFQINFFTKEDKALLAYYSILLWKIIRHTWSRLKEQEKGELWWKLLSDH